MIFLCDNFTNILILFYVSIRQMATTMNTHTMYYSSNTKDVLTPYAEGLDCENFNKK